jgi:NADPH:quinone reductase-like Zn-dependent oxidoreductase
MAPREIVISRAGGPEVLQEREREPARLGAGQVRVAVAAAGVNFADVSGRLGTYPDAPPIPYVPGYEVGGAVIEVGRDVRGLAVGDRVCALTRFGGYAEEVVLTPEQVFPLPPAIDPVVAAGIPVTYLTATTCLFHAGGLRDGMSVLILGGAGGVGTAAIQLARRRDVRILATAGGAAKCEWLRAHGVDQPIDHREGRVAEAVAEATGGRGVDLVLDPVGGRGLADSVALCAPLGRVVWFGASATNPGKHRQLAALVREAGALRFFNLFRLIERNVGVHGINMLKLADARPELMREMMTDVLAAVAAGELAPVIGQRFPLTAAGAAAAHHFLHDRKNIGKLLLVA